MSGKNGGGETESRTATDRTDAESTDSGAVSMSAVEQASGVGLSMTLATGVLLAFGYYGVLGVAERGLGEAVPSPFYLLGLALVFVVGLSRSESYDTHSLVRVAGTTAVFGTLVILAIEGGSYLWERPELALDGFTGIAVLAISLVVAALAYVSYLSAVKTSGQPG